jgi:beta-glucosidase/6-phospho-beta-glucosidase/beta-galactosidase
MGSPSISLFGHGRTLVETNRACETDLVSTSPRLLVTLEGYAVEGGFDRVGGPTTCYGPTIALKRHSAPGTSDNLWHDYERVLDFVPQLGVDGVRLTLEWARIEPQSGAVDHDALARYVEVIRHARQLGLSVTVALVDAVWPLWIGMESWLLPWVRSTTIEHAERVVEAINDLDIRVLVFTNAADMLSRGFIDGVAPPWRKGARRECAIALEHIKEVEQALRESAVGGQLVSSHAEVAWRGSPEDIVEARQSTSVEELYVRSLLRGSGPTSVREGLLVHRSGVWCVSDAGSELAALL